MSTPGNSKKASARPPKPKFAMTGVVVGSVAGIALGFVVETASKPNVIFMQVGGIVGIATGLLVESVHYWWRMQIYRGFKQSSPRTTIIRG